MYLNWARIKELRFISEAFENMSKNDISKKISINNTYSQNTLRAYRSSIEWLESLKSVTYLHYVRCREMRGGGGGGLWWLHASHRVSHYLRQSMKVSEWNDTQKHGFSWVKVTSVNETEWIQADVTVTHAPEEFHDITGAKKRKLRSKILWR